jgi:hypothetical protein
MPRRSRPQLVVFDENFEMPAPQDPIKPVKDFLKNQVWDLIKSKRDNNEIECSICLEEVCCQKCYTILTCGHSFHLSCIIKCNTCPMCRGS